MTAMRASGRLRRLGVLVTLLAAIGAVRWLSGTINWQDREPTSSRTEAPCARLGFPCTWRDVSPDVLQQSLALGEVAVGRLAASSSAETAQWLRSQAGVEEVLESATVVAFRLKGGRRIWLDQGLLADLFPATFGTPIDARRPGESEGFNALEVLTRALVPPATAYAQGPGPPRETGIVGIDFDQDGSITQRDPRRALILAPDPERYGAEIDDLKALLEATNGYDFEDSVDVRSGPRALPEMFAKWNDYDLVHVATGSASACWGGDEAGWLPPDAAPGAVNDTNCAWFLATGLSVPNSAVGDVSPSEPGAPPNLPGVATSAYQDSLNHLGLEIFAVAGAQGLEWRVYVTTSFFQDAYSEGVRRALVFLNASNRWGLTRLANVIAGSPATSTVVMWRSDRTVADAHRLALGFYERAAEGWSPGDIFETTSGLECHDQLVDDCRLSARLTTDLRIREIVTLGTPLRSGQPPTLVEDGARLELLLADPLAAAPVIDFVVDAEGIVPADQDIPVRVELDGLTVAQQRLSGATLVTDGPRDLLRLPFAGVPLPQGIFDRDSIELQAVLELPRGGESRYAARLEVARCHVPSQGDFSGTLVGSADRLIRPGSRGAFAKILPSPLGGWTLQLQSRGLDDNDLALTLMFDDDIAPLGTAAISDPDLVSPGIGGMAGRFDRNRRINWTEGRALIDFDVVRARPGAAFDWVCGSIQADLAGFAPSGQVGGRTVRGQFEGRFWAEWYRSR